MKVISGGQTGVDRIALEVAKEAGLETGGTAPKHYKTENGFDYSLKEFGLVENDSFEYNVRTKKNVLDADITLLFGNTASVGSRLTISFCKQHKKPYYENYPAGHLYKLLTDLKPKVINVAGNRGSKISEAEVKWLRMTLKSVFNRIAADERSVATNVP